MTEPTDTARIDFLEHWLARQPLERIVRAEGRGGKYRHVAFVVSEGETLRSALDAFVADEIGR